MHQSWTSQKFLWWFHFPLQYIPLALWKLIWERLQKFDIGQSCHRSYSHIKEKLDTRNVFKKQKIQNCIKQEKCDIPKLYTWTSIRLCLFTKSHLKKDNKKSLDNRKQQIKRSSFVTSYFADGPQDKCNNNVQYCHHKWIVWKYHKWTSHSGGTKMTAENGL